MKIKVAIVLPYFGIGGAENMVSRLASHIDLSRVDVEVICIYGERQNNCLEKAIKDHGVPIKYIGKGKGFSIQAVIRLCKELSLFHPSIVHTHLSACVYCAPWILTHKALMLHTVHNMPKYELTKLKQLIMKLMYKIGKAVPVAISNEIQSMMTVFYNLTQKPELVYNPVDIAKYHLPRKKHDGVKLVTAGRISIQKNQKLLLDAMKDVCILFPSLHLTILGDGPLRKELEEYNHLIGLEKNINFEGNVNNVEEYFAQSDIFVLSSDYEGLPLVVLEAMAASLPIISTNVGGIRDIVNSNGILVELKNKNALVEAIEVLVKNAGLRKSLGHQSFENVQKYDSIIIADQYVDLYEKYTRM